MDGYLNNSPNSAFTIAPPPGLMDLVPVDPNDLCQTRRIRIPTNEQANLPFSRHAPLSTSLSDLVPNLHYQNGLMSPAPPLNEGLLGFQSNFYSEPQGTNPTLFHQSASLDLMTPSRTALYNRVTPHLPASGPAYPTQQPSTVGYSMSALSPFTLDQFGPQPDPSLFFSGGPGPALPAINRGDVRVSGPQYEYVGTPYAEPLSNTTARAHREWAPNESSYSPNFVGSERPTRQTDSFSYDWGLQLFHSNCQSPQSSQLDTSRSSSDAQLQVLTHFLSFLTGPSDLRTQADNL